MGNAPVCHISVDETVTQPTARNLAYVPPAHDLQSALKAIEALRQNLMILTGQVAAQRPSVTFMQQPGSSPGSQAAGGSRPSNSQPSQGGKNPNVGRWVEDSRAVVVRRITNPNDPEQFVDVKQINRLTMKDTVTGELWVWGG